MEKSSVSFINKKDEIVVGFNIVENVMIEGFRIADGRIRLLSGVSFVIAKPVDEEEERIKNGRGALMIGDVVDSIFLRVSGSNFNWCKVVSLVGIERL